MDYIFTAPVAVPEGTIRAIIAEFMSNVLHECLGEDIDLEDFQINKLGDKMNAVLTSICEANKVNVDGWFLKRDQVLEVAGELRACRKIGAIKAFRMFTGAGLKEAKDLIDKFCENGRDAGPVAAIQFTMAFGG